MNPLISIPRQALAELLQAAGSPLTPEEYVASLPETGAYKKYPSRARAAALSKPVLLLVAILSGVFMLFFFGFENVIVFIGLSVVTFFEYRVHRYFRELNPAAPSLGFRNQSGFAAGILIYCLYHAFAPVHLSSEAQSMMDESNIDPSMLMDSARLFYLFIAVTAGGSQFWLAWYYRSAQVRTPA
jgi:hypothetical protein